MSVTPTKQAQFLKDYTFQAVQKHFKKSIKHEKEVLADQDPEPLHQMRVGMRRLRTALQVFDPVLELPKAVSSNQIKKVAQRLGAVRDLDVLKVRLESQYLPDLEGKEQKRLHGVLEKLQQQRRQDFATIEQTLQSDRYRQLKQGFNDWLAKPQYGAIADLPILSTLPDLLTPLLCCLMLHPGWLVGTQARSGERVVAKSPGAKAIRQWLAQDSEQLHDLRKQTKQVRYQTEFFTPFYDSEYEQQVQDFQAIQEVLGQMQDYSVLKEFLATSLKSDWQKDLPTLAQRLEHEQISLWSSWQPMQQRYLDTDFRDRLRRIALTPQPSQV